MFNMKVKKIFLSFILLVSVLLLASCNKVTLINEVINRNVSYEEDISILDFEDAIVEASKIASESSIGVVTTTGGYIFTTESFGTGIVIKKQLIAPNKFEYHVLTNRHVVLTSNGSEKDVSVQFPNGEEIKAEICKVDYFIDVAIIKFQSPREITPAKVSLDKAEVGRFVVAVGNPYNIDKYYQSVTIGNISHALRVIEEEDGRGNKVNNIYIQHTAALNSGNSGGGLFNIKGELIGINSWKIVDEAVEGMNFSIPISTVYSKYKEYFD